MVNEGFRRRDVDFSLLPPLHHRTTSDRTYTLTKRLTACELSDRYCNEVSAGQLDYVGRIEKARSKLYNNIECAQRMDALFGTAERPSPDDSDSEIAPPQILEDRSKKLSCPLLPCQVTTFKLRRHITTVHTNVTCADTEAALAMARIMERNKGAPTTSPITRGPKKRKCVNYHEHGATTWKLQRVFIVPSPDVEHDQPYPRNAQHYQQRLEVPFIGR